MELSSRSVSMACAVLPRTRCLETKSLQNSATSSFQFWVSPTAMRSSRKFLISKSSIVSGSCGPCCNGRERCKREEIGVSDWSKEMKKFLAIFVALFMVFLSKAQAQNVGGQQLPMMHWSGLLNHVETIPLPGDGYMDHLTVDVKGQRVFISGEAAKSLIAVDLRE